MSDRSLGQTADAGHGAQDEAGREDTRDLLTPRWMSFALVGTAALVLSAWMYLAVTHVDDRYRLDHVSGARMALAQHFDDGTLYPELYDGEFYGGTRFMPLPIVLHGLAARSTGEYLVAGKVLSYAATLGLLATMVVLLRRLRCPLPLTLILASLVLTTNTGLAGSMNIRADVLPLLLLLLAVGIVANSDRPTATVGAAALASLALISKVSAVWAPMAIVIWLLTRDRRRLALFSGAYIASSGALILLFIAISDGRILENVFGLSTSGIVGLRSILVAPYRFVHLMVGDATSAWAVVPLAILAVWVAVRNRKSSLYLLSLICASGIVVVVLIDVGTGWNQLIDLVVLTTLVIGELAARVEVSGRLPATRRLMAMGLGFILLWVSLSGAIVTLAPDVLATVTGEASYPPDPLDGVATSRTRLLSEDPYVPMSLGQMPLVLDAFMLPRLEEREPGAIADLIHRIERHEFDLVVLIEPLEPVDRSWWSELDLGVPLARAISRAYASAGRIHGYYLYEPRRAGAAG